MTKMKMPIMFSVHSSRISDIILDEGTTVARFKDMLAADGYDVKEALPVLTRHATKDSVIGGIDFYVIQEGDSVDFMTKKAATPALSSIMQRLHEKEQQQNSTQNTQNKCACGHACKCHDADKRSDELGTMVIRGISREHAVKVTRFLESL